MQADVVFDVIPLLQELEEPLLGEVRAAFASSLQRIWQVMAGISGLGLLISLFMRHVSLHTSVDSDWGTVEKQGPVDQENEPKAGDATPIGPQLASSALGGQPDHQVVSPYKQCGSLFLHTFRIY